MARRRGAEKRKKYRTSEFYADKNVAEAEISGTYGTARLKKCFRKIELSGSEIRLTDELELKSPSLVNEVFVTRCDAVYEDGTVKITDNGECIAELISDKQTPVSIFKTPHREHDGSVSEITQILFPFVCTKGKFTLIIK